MSTSHTFYGTSSSESLPVTPEKKWRFRGPNHVRVMLLHSDGTMVLMEDTANGWDLPLFKYKTGIGEGTRSRRVCRDFTKWLGHEIQFIAVVELLGELLFFDYDYEKDSCGRLAKLKLVVMEHPDHANVEAMTLPDGAYWKDADFLSEMLETIDDEDERVKPFEIVLRCIQPGSTVLSSIPEPRHQLGWFRKATSFLASSVKADGTEAEGPIVQHHASFTSTVLIAETSEQSYFLKAPARGSNETEITTAISSLFEENAPDVVATSSELRCFVSRELEIGKVNVRDAILTLGRIQLKSISYLAELKQAGCVVRDLSDIRNQIKRWAEGYRTERVQSIKLFIGQSACYLMYICRRLSELKVPLTLIHGDFDVANVGCDPKDSERVVLLDWEFACISHPFLDFFRGRLGWGTHELSEDLIIAYLELWTDYEDLATLREAFMMGSLLGRILRVWSLWERASMCEHQKHSSLEEWMNREVRVLDGLTCATEMPMDKGYSGSPEAKLESEMDITRLYYHTTK